MRFEDSGVFVRKDQLQYRQCRFVVPMQPAFLIPVAQYRSEICFIRSNERETTSSGNARNRKSKKGSQTHVDSEIEASIAWSDSRERTTYEEKRKGESVLQVLSYYVSVFARRDSDKKAISLYPSLQPLFLGKGLSVQV